MFKLVGRTIGPAQPAFWGPGSRPLTVLIIIGSCHAANFGSGVLAWILDLAALLTADSTRLGTPAKLS